MLSETQKMQIQEDVRDSVRKAYQAEMGVQNLAATKRFSPFTSFEEANQGVNMNYGKVKIYNPVGELIEEPSHSFPNLGEFAQSIIRAAGDEGYQTNALREWHSKTQGELSGGEDSQGGYLIPSQFSQTIWEMGLEQSLIRPRTSYQPMAHRQLEIPALVSDDNSANYFGGIQIQRGSEGGQMSATNPKYSKIQLNLHKVYGLVHITNELIEDSSVAMEAHLKRVFPAAIAFQMDYDFLVGNGAGQPLGMLDSSNPALITVDAVAGQGANTIIAENIIAMYARLFAGGERNAIWIANKDTFQQLATLSLTVGASGIPVWMPASQLAAKPYRELMGLPLFLSEKVPSLGTAGDIALVDPSQYVVGGRGAEGAPNIASSIHLKFDYDMTSFRFTLRYDGQPLWASAMTPKQSTTTLSPFIVLSSSRS